MLFLLPIRIGRYSFYIRLYPYGDRTHTILRRPGRLARRLQRIRWLPIMRLEHWDAVQDAKKLGYLGFPLPFRELRIVIYRHQPDAAAND
jgi:hypothetical protein